MRNIHLETLNNLSKEQAELRCRLRNIDGHGSLEDRRKLAEGIRQNRPRLKLLNDLVNSGSGNEGLDRPRHE